MFKSKLPPKQIERTERRREAAELQAEVAMLWEKVAGIDELVNAVIDLPYEIKALKGERIPQYRGAVHHRPPNLRSHRAHCRTYPTDQKSPDTCVRITTPSGNCSVNWINSCSIFSTSAGP